MHGDLSAYNLLHSDGRLRVISTSIDARGNPHALRPLVRDVANVCRYFASQGADAEPLTFATEVWELHARGQL